MIIILRRSMEINKNQRRTCKGPTKDVNCHGHDFVGFIMTASASEEYRKHCTVMREKFVPYSYAITRHRGMTQNVSRGGGWSPHAYCQTLAWKLPSWAVERRSILFFVPDTTPQNWSWTPPCESRRDDAPSSFNHSMGNRALGSVSWNLRSSLSFRETLGRQ